MKLKWHHKQCGACLTYTTMVFWCRVYLHYFANKTCFKQNSRLWDEDNGMLRHSLVTLEGSNLLWLPLPSSLINSLNKGFDRGNSLYQKLWDHLGKRAKLDLSSTKKLFTLCELETSQVLLRRDSTDGRAVALYQASANTS